MSAPPPLPRTDPKAARRALGMLLMAFGGLIAALCGLCTIGLDTKLAFEFAAANSKDAGTILTFISVVGGVPTVIGLVLFFVGWSIRRSRR